MVSYVGTWNIPKFGNFVVPQVRRKCIYILRIEFIQWLGLPPFGVYGPSLSGFANWQDWQVGARRYASLRSCS